MFFVISNTIIVNHEFIILTGYNNFSSCIDNAPFFCLWVFNLGITVFKSPSVFPLKFKYGFACANVDITV